MEAIFWTVLALIMYTIVGYPFCILLWKLIARTQFEIDDKVRTVEIVIPVHNGEAEISSKLTNCLQQSYPKSHLKIIVVSDGSTDDTVQIANSFEHVECVVLNERVGKVAAQNAVMEKLSADVIVFTDVGIRMDNTAVASVVSRFADQRVGVVSCRDELEGDSVSNSSEGLYIKYDMLVRQLMEGAGSLIGVTGGFYAVRRSLLLSPWPTHFAPDFYVALLAIRNHYIAIEDPSTRAFYGTASVDSDEYQRKVRTVTRGMHTLFGNASILNPFRFPSTAWKLISHKILRWGTPILLGVLLITNLLIVIRDPSPFFIAMAIAQVLGWIFAALSNTLGMSHQPFRMASQVWMVNCALVSAWSKLFRRNRIVMWKPTRR